MVDVGGNDRPAPGDFVAHEFGRDKLGDGGDVWWEQVSDTERNLVPRGGAGWAIVKGKPFEKVGLEDLKKASYSKDKLPGTVSV